MPLRDLPFRVPLAAAALTVAVAAVALGQDAGKGDPMMGGTRKKVVHDPRYFREHVLPLLEQHCVSCHERGDENNESNNQLIAALAGAWSDAAVEHNYKNVISLLDADDPARSRLLLKLVPMVRGGLDHDGGKADDEYFPSALTDPKGPLVAWIFGAGADDAPPIAVHGPVPRTVEVGTEVQLDARLSFDPDESDVSVSWELYEAPLGARARIAKAKAKRASIEPDRPGPYVVRLHVSDGKLAGWPALIRFSATPRSTEPAIPRCSTSPVGSSKVMRARSSLRPAA